jgi:hypothetical protein
MTDKVTRIRTGSDTVSRVSVLESQIASIGYDIEKLETKVEGQYNMLHSRISDMRDDVHKELNDKHAALMDKLDEQSKSSSEQHAVISKKVSEMEKWRWMIMGAAIVAGYILAHVKLDKLIG